MKCNSWMLTLSFSTHGFSTQSLTNNCGTLKHGWLSEAFQVMQLCPSCGITWIMLSCLKELLKIILCSNTVKSSHPWIKSRNVTKHTTSQFHHHNDWFNTWCGWRRKGSEKSTPVLAPFVSCLIDMMVASQITSSFLVERSHHLPSLHQWSESPCSKKCLPPTLLTDHKILYKMHLQCSIYPWCSLSCVLNSSELHFGQTWDKNQQDSFLMTENTNIHYDLFQTCSHDINTLYNKTEIYLSLDYRKDTLSFISTSLLWPSCHSNCSNPFWLSPCVWTSLTLP